MPLNMPSSPPEPWLGFLSELDAATAEPIDFHCLGGFVVCLAYGLARTTADVDVLMFVPKSEAFALVKLGQRGSVLHQRHKVYLDPVNVATPPEDYDQRLVEMFPGSFKNIRLFALDPYDVALTKLERNSPKDREDVKYLARIVPFDLSVLRERYQKELRDYLLIPEREDLTLKLWIELIEEERTRR
jgi:hypothetical protein